MRQDDCSGSVCYCRSCSFGGSRVEHITGDAVVKGPWTAIVFGGDRTFYCSSFCDTPGETERGPEQGDPKGDQRYIVNFVAKLENDGCEWRWNTNSNTHYILYRC